jgi:hypothetical protein
LTFNNGGDDALNEVKGKATYLGTKVFLAHRVRLHRFPDHPAGGPFGSHTIALVTVSRRAAFASVHGEHLDASIVMAMAYALQLERATSRFVRSRSSA